MSIVRFAPLLLLAVARRRVGAVDECRDVSTRSAIALKKKGPLALFSGDLKPLMNEGKAAGRQGARDCGSRRSRPGDKPRYCPPEGKQAHGQRRIHEGAGRHPAAERAQDRHDRGDDAHPRAQIPLPGA